MQPANTPEPIKVPKQAEVQTVAQNLLEHSQLANRPENAIGDMVLPDYGQIDHMNLPEGWHLSQVHHREIGGYSFRQCNPPDDPEVAICFFYRGLGLPPQESQEFCGILTKPPHQLDQSEHDKCEVVLRGRDDPQGFTMRKLFTTDLNGKRVLVLEGTFTEKQENVFQLFINAGGSGRFVQEIYYQAPNGSANNSQNLYDKYLPAAQNSFKSIIWKFQPPKD